MTKDVDVFTNAIDQLKADGGGDEPEMCLTGILEALKVCERNSLFFVYTDAAAKDEGLMTQVISIAKEKESKIHFLLTGNVYGKRKKRSISVEKRSSGYPYSAIAASSGGTVVGLVKDFVPAAKLSTSSRFSSEDPYSAIAASSGGTVVRTSNAEIAAVSLDLINAEEISKSEVDLVKVSMPATRSSSTSQFNFTVDPTATQLTIRVSGMGISSMTLVHSNTSVPPLNITVAANLQTLKSWKVENPPSGKFVLSFDTRQSYDLSVTCTTSLATKAFLATLNLQGSHVGFFPVEGEPVSGAEVHIVAEIMGMNFYHACSA